MVKTILTILSIVSLIVFVGYIMYKIELNNDIALLFFGAFISLVNQITSYFFTRKSADSVHKEGDTK
jgi:accessory gene regulator protein AgrB